MNKKILWGLIALLFVSNLVTATYFLMGKNKTNKINKVEIPIAENNQKNNSVNTTTEQGDGSLQVDWLKNLEPMNFNNAGFDASVVGPLAFYRAGKISTGKYAGSDFFLAIASEMGDSVIRGIFRDNKFVILTKQSNSIYSSYIDEKAFGSEVSIDNESFVENLEPAKTINIPGTSSHIVFKNQSTDALFENSPKEAFKLENGDTVYVGNDFMVKGIDGTYFDYILYLDFLPNGGIDNSSSISQSISQSNLSITYPNGKTVNQDYTLRASTCGSVEFVALSDSDLKILGTSGGANLYELKDEKFKLPGSEIPLLEENYDSYYPGYDAESGKEKAKISYQEFLANHPVIFWKDALGRFWQFKDIRYQTAVECGKPVIYLYPEKTTDVNVSVVPAGGFTKTEPVYRDGWKVKADPQSNIYNYSDQKNYPYLFWEGYALGYNRPTDGFVVESSNIEKFLQDKLAKQGLIGREIDEFIEYWAPKMTESPYYFITFVPQADFEKLAPLTVSPKPDTVIRVFMDYQPLEKFVKVKEQNLYTPKRLGFTVVEWGGALHK